MPGHSLLIQAEAHQAHENVHRPHNGWHKGETIPQWHEGHVSLELQEEEEAQEVSQYLPQEVARQLQGELPARLAGELAAKPVPECVQGQKGVSHCHPAEEVTLWRCQQAFG